MKNILLTLIGIITILNGYSQGWEMQQSNTTSNLTDVHFFDSKNGCAVGNNGTILKTSDGGANWILQVSGTTNHIESVHFTDSLIGFAVTYEELLKTTDGGNNWFIQDTMTSALLSPIFFIGKDTGFVVGDGRMLKTMDGGVNWIKQKSAEGFSVKSLWATNAETLYLGGENSLTVKSIDGGLNWSPIVNHGTYGMMESIFFTNQNSGYFVGGGWAQGFTGSLFMKTIDGGMSWSYSLGNINKWLTSIFFTDGLNGYLTAQDGSILKTMDAGINWVTLNSNVTTSLNSIFFTDSLVGYTVGAGGTILKTTNGGVGITVPSLIDNLKIFPNPTSAHLTIEATQNIKEVNVIDLTGKTIKAFISTTNTINVSDLPSGIYFIKLITDEGIITEKFVKQ